MCLVAEQRKGRGGSRRDQARRGLLPLVALLPLAGCAVPADIDPRVTIANVFGAHLEGRLPPPGLDRPFPSLGSLPPRPEPVDRAALAALSEQLSADRAQAAEPQAPALSRSLAQGPPSAPDLRLPRGAPTLAPAAPEAPAAPPPPAGPADFLGIPAPPSADLLVPRRP
jgi:hypothetical protein